VPWGDEGEGREEMKGRSGGRISIRKERESVRMKYS